jgi:hypothetical protein
MTTMDDSANLLHDHYKDSFAHIRDRENQRELLFLIVVALLGGIVLQLRYSLVLPQTVSEVTIAGVKLKLSNVPMAALLSTSWTFLSVILMRYCQTAVHVVKQYDYLHGLERRLSATIGVENAIYRESTGYLTEKTKCFRHWTWIFYTKIFPAIVIVSVGWSLFLEREANAIPVPHKVYDSAMGVITVLTVMLYAGGLWPKNSEPRDQGAGSGPAASSGACS